jgi:two-component system cell cycle response regulator
VKVLIADSNALFTRLVRLKLEKWGHRVDVAFTGREAWDLARRGSYRMVMLDWPLEGIDGGTLCRHIRRLERDRYTYILFYSERSDHDSVMAALEAGADDYLFKPFNPLTLKLKLKTSKRLLNVEDELRRIASHDPMTGLINESTFARFFRTYLAGAVRYGDTGTILRIRIANQGEIFRTFGYEAAAKVMIETSHALSRVVRAADLVAKVSEDTFVILLPQTPALHVPVVIDKVRAEIAAVAISVGAEPVPIETAVAFDSFPREGVSADAILDGLRATADPAPRASAG